METTSTAEGAVIRVAATSIPNKVAGAIAFTFREAPERKLVRVRAIGPGAVNQAVKAIAIARGFLAPEGHDIVVVPAFIEIPDVAEGDNRTAMVFEVQDRYPKPSTE